MSSLKPINKLGSTLCYSCRAIVGPLCSELLLCPSCQESAIKLLKESVSFMNMVPNKRFGDNYTLCNKIDNFLAYEKTN